MKYLDIIGQTVILFLTGMMIIAYSWSGLMYGQFFIGVWANDQFGCFRNRGDTE